MAAPVQYALVHETEDGEYGYMIYRLRAVYDSLDDALVAYADHLTNIRETFHGVNIIQEIPRNGPLQEPHILYDVLEGTVVRYVRHDNDASWCHYGGTLKHMQKYKYLLNTGRGSRMVPIKFEFDHAFQHPLPDGLTFPGPTECHRYNRNRTNDHTTVKRFLAGTESPFVFSNAPCLPKKPRPTH